MAKFVLALGVLMSVIGVYAVIWGYPIIQVERGWAAVIAGSTILAGGLVTIALGLVLRALAAIAAALRSLAVLTPSVIVPGETPPDVHGGREADVSFAAPPDAPPLATAAPALAVAMPAVVEAFTVEQTAPSREPTPRQSAELLEPAAEVPEPTAPTAAASEPATIAEAVPAQETDGYELQAPSTADHDLRPEERPEAPASPSVDWLDQAFSALDHDLAAAAPRAEAETPNAPDTTVAQEPEHAGTNVTETYRAEPTETEPAPAEAARAEAARAEPAPVAAPEEPAPVPHASAAPDLAVIGRYESDGTSYIMYADGSIDAQSEAGVYRFGSMAELRAFIEG